jgi:hypothetical protein
MDKEVHMIKIFAEPTPVPNDYIGATWGSWYWPTWVVIALLSLLVPEVYALVTNVKNTQSYWVWHELDVHTGLAPNTWTSAHFIFFGLWSVFAIWLTGHFFWRLWT